jgi:hypothetical protein
MTQNLPAVPEWSRELIKEVAMDIGKELVAYIEIMYPDVFAAGNSGFKLSMRNHIHNDIVGAVDALATQDKARAWLEARKKHRREWLAQWRKIRNTPML